MLKSVMMFIRQKVMRLSQFAIAQQALSKMSGQQLPSEFQITRKVKIKMNLDEFRKFVEAQREASKQEALAILSATIRKENK